MQKIAGPPPSKKDLAYIKEWVARNEYAEKATWIYWMLLEEGSYDIMYTDMPGFDGTTDVYWIDRGFNVIPWPYEDVLTSASSWR